eukprot:8621066-Pyramimonas_sp.AAC.1
MTQTAPRFRFWQGLEDVREGRRGAGGGGKEHVGPGRLSGGQHQKCRVGECVSAREGPAQRAARRGRRGGGRGRGAYHRGLVRGRVHRPLARSAARHQGVGDEYPHIRQRCAGGAGGAREGAIPPPASPACGR